MSKEIEKVLSVNKDINQDVNAILKDLDLC